jgi:hypothetical protein
MNLHTYQKGDKVRFLNEVGGGIVKRLRKDGMVLVENEDGFDYPMPPNELVLVESAGFSKGNSLEKNTERKADDMRVNESNDEKKILLAFTRNTSNNAVILHIINDTPWFFPCAIYTRVQDDEHRLIVQDVLEPDTKMEVGEFPDNDLDEVRQLVLQGFFAGDQMKSLHPLVQGKVKNKATRLLLSGNYETNEYFSVPALIFDIYNSKTSAPEVIDEVLHEKALQDAVDAEKAVRSKKHPSPVIWEEDLHINVLVDSVVGMSNTEILNFQMDYFRKILDKAIVEKVTQVVFIHGIGNGTLKKTLRDAVEKEYRLLFEDASFKEYGFGATKVFPGRKAK